MSASDPLVRLIYVSRNAIGAIGQDLRTEIENILADARQRNPQMGITGMLTFSSGYFAQVLEGPKAEVEDLYETIQMDPRHDEVVVLSITPAQERAFSAWSMGFVGTTPEMDRLFRDMRANTCCKATSDNGAEILSTLTTLARRHDTKRSA